MAHIAGIILRDCVRQTDKIYSYLIPDELISEIVPGSYVEVPFGKGNRSKTAVVYSVTESSEDLSGLKPIAGLLDPLPVMTEEQLLLIDKISSRYLCTRGDAVALMVPSMVGKVSHTKKTFIRLVSEKEAKDALESGKLRSIAHIHILEFLLKFGDTEKKSLLLQTKATDAQLNALRLKGLTETYKKEVGGEDSDVIPENAGESFNVTHDLNDEQIKAAERVCNTPDTAKVFLLHGITGSGKTEVYLKCAGDALNKGGSVIYLVPEISLTPQTVSWITARFGKSAAVLHSRLTDKQRFLEWDRIRTGTARVVVAPRSGIFAPVKDLKLIIIDEEHESSYKSESFPRYNTKDIAMLRAKYNNCKVILGSATPSVSSYYGAECGVYELLTLKKRANPDAKLPKVIPVDMKEQIKLGAGDMLSIPLRQAMARAFADKKQVLLFLNRRGYSRTLICSVCGEPCVCPNCSVGMTLHSTKRSTKRLLVCHYCGYTIPAADAECKTCGNTKFTGVGIGTQQLEELLKTLYPHEKILRMDQDTTMTAGSYENILTSFREHEASILIGTQMIAKGHDFPEVTVVGILGADLIATSADYRSSERAFQLITQAAGRAGRSDFPGEVYLQSYNPSNPLLKYAGSQDYSAFYRNEINYRKQMRLPPFKATGEIMLSLPAEDMLIVRAEALRNYLKDYLEYQDKKYGFEFYGPVPAPIYELRGRYRMCFVIKSKKKAFLNEVFRQVMKDFPSELYPLSFDTDASGS